MSDRKIKNISALQHPLAIRVMNDRGTGDVTVMLSGNEVFWCPNGMDTKSMLIYEKKRFIELFDDQKPDDANYYETYPDGYWEQEQETSEDKEETVSDIGEEQSEEQETSGIAEQDEEQDEEQDTGGIEERDEEQDVNGAEDQQKGKWEEDDLKWLKRNYPKHGLAHCAEHLNRNKKSVKKKVEFFKLKKAK